MTTTAQRLPSPHLQSPGIRVVRRGELAHESTGPRRGYAHIGFDDYPAHAPGRLDFGSLVLFAEGTMQPAEGFGMHRHENIENMMLLFSGRLRHTDSEGGTHVMGADEIANFSAGAGAEHAEFVEGDEDVHALVIWLRPQIAGGPPRFHRRAAPRSDRKNRLHVLASGRAPTGNSVLPLDADAELLGSLLSPGATVTHRIEPGRRGYAIAVGGGLDVNGASIDAGDRVLLEGTGDVAFTARDAAELVLVDFR